MNQNDLKTNPVLFVEAYGRLKSFHLEFLRRTPCGHSISGRAFTLQQGRQPYKATYTGKEFDAWVNRTSQPSQRTT